MRRVLAAVLAVIVLTAAWLLSPLTLHGLESHAHPATDYEDALARFARLEAEDSPAIAADCGSQLYTHGARTGRVIVLLHGLTNCPAQFDSLGRLLFARGANVLIPRLPRHGVADKMTDALAGSNAGELCAFTDRVLDLAAGLGDSITVAGLSLGGVMAAWAAQERPDVDHAVLIAPLLGAARTPGAWTPLAARLATVLPNVFVWWDDKAKQDLAGPKHVYPRFATRSIAASLRIGWALRSEARHHPPACRSVTLIMVSGDQAVDNRLNVEVLAAWRRNGARATDRYEFPASLHLNHDVVDPDQVGGNPAVTYPVLLERIGR